MMNSTDLIIGHFEGSLTPVETSRLDELLRTSPEVRAAFEQQRTIEEGMLEDSESLIPPIGLREATLAAALGGALTTTVGGGIAAWLSTKAAVVLSTLALGGVIVGGIVFSDDDAGEETETVVAPGQMERVESIDPVGEPVVQDQSTTDRAEVPAVSSPTDAQPLGSGGQTARSTRNGQTQAGSAESDRDSDGGHEDQDLDIFGNNPLADVPTETKVNPDSTKR